MTFLWLIIWLLQGTPALQEWNSWAVSLLVCIALDLMGGARSFS